jgi:hypothetical protein
MEGFRISGVVNRGDSVEASEQVKVRNKVKDKIKDKVNDPALATTG